METRFTSVALVFQNGGKVDFGDIQPLRSVWNLDKILKRTVKLLVGGKPPNKSRRWEHTRASLASLYFVTALVPGIQQSSDKDSGTVLVNKMEKCGLEKVRWIVEFKEPWLMSTRKKFFRTLPQGPGPWSHPEHRGYQWSGRECRWPGHYQISQDPELWDWPNVSNWKMKTNKQKCRQTGTQGKTSQIKLNRDKCEVLLWDSKPPLHKYRLGRQGLTATCVKKTKGFELTTSFTEANSVTWWLKKLMKSQAVWIEIQFPDAGR